MATYGNANGQIPFTGWSPTLATGSATAGGAAGSVQFNGLTQDDYRVATKLNNQSNRAIRQLMRTLLGAAAGTTATAPYTRVRAVSALSDPLMLGGLVSIESTNYVNRATTTADRDALIAMLDRLNGPSSYPVDLSGNGGSGGIAGLNSKLMW